MFKTHFQLVFMNFKLSLVSLLLVFSLVSCTNEGRVKSEIIKETVVSKIIGIDIRRPEELIENPAPGSIHIEMGEIADRFEKEFPLKNVEVNIFCEAGGRAERVKEFLMSKGYTHIKNMGSWREWNATQR